MAALTTGRRISKYGNGPMPNKVPANVSTATTAGIGLAASVTIYPGAMVSVDSSGYARPARATNTDRVIGVFQPQNGYALTGTTNGTIKLVDCIDFGSFPMANSSSGDQITTVHIDGPCYVVDDQTVAATSNNGTRPLAGVVVDVLNDNTVLVNFAPILGFSVASALRGSNVTFATAATTATVAETVYAKFPYAGTVTGIAFAPTAALAANGTNYVTLDIKRGASGVAAGSRVSMGTVTTNTTGGVSLAAFTDAALTLSGTAANLVCAAGDLISATITVAAGTPAWPAGAVTITYNPA